MAGAELVLLKKKEKEKERKREKKTRQNLNFSLFFFFLEEKIVLHSFSLCIRSRSAPRLSLCDHEGSREWGLEKPSFEEDER